MKRTIKQCQGFKGEAVCSACMRQNDNAEPLVSELSTIPYSGGKTCIHLIRAI